MFFIANADSDGEPSLERFALKFNNADLAVTFKKAFNHARALDYLLKLDYDLVPEEEVTLVLGWTAPMTLELRDNIETGEESETEIYCQRTKLLRFRDGERKEPGLGNSKLLRQNETGQVRYLLQQEKTRKSGEQYPRH